MMGVLAVNPGLTGVSTVIFFLSYLPLVIVHLSKSLCMLEYFFATTAVENTSQNCERQWLQPVIFSKPAP